MKTALMILVVMAISGCVMTNGNITISKIGKINPNNKNIALTNDSYYNTDLAIALAKYGFHIKSMPMQEHITHKDIKGNSYISYNKATARYGLQLDVMPNYLWTCSIGSGTWVNAKVIITDLKNANMVLVISQSGTDKPCISFSSPPIWLSMAKAIHDNWN